MDFVRRWSEKTRDRRRVYILEVEAKRLIPVYGMSRTAEWPHYT